MFEKYLALARDATTSGDRVAAENFYQHAEHYYRILNFNANPSGPNGSGGAKPRPNGGGNDGDAGRDADVMANGRPKDSGGLAVAGDSQKQPEGSDGTTAEAGNSDPEKTPSE